MFPRSSPLGLDKWKIFFTNQAANNMKDRRAFGRNMTEM